MITRLLIANRGEIACRIIRTARSLGIHTIAVYSQSDAQAQHVLQADEAWFIGESPVNQSYLCSDQIITVATQARADAIHPGYGFLSENALFASMCQQHNIIFVGPDEYALQAMGSKSQAKAIMQQAQVPLVPGYHGDQQGQEKLQEEAEKIGYPVILKASAGGGGKGMRIVSNAAEFKDSLAAAQREALASFADDHMLVEKYIAQPRHIEVQVFCDRHGNGVYLFDRDCSVQRRHQKIIEEAPAPGLSKSLRQQMGIAAVNGALAIDYVGAGTVEFLLDAQQQFYFMEMNTRLQVEHPVTEMITNEDLVAWQIAVANGDRLPKVQAELTCSGHAIEVRIYAENPNDNFLPATGFLTAYQPPLTNHNIRIDSGVIQGDEISIYYDPMFAKLICKGHNRQAALQRCQQALHAFFIAGVSTNLNFLQMILSHPDFVAGAVSTHFIADNHTELLPEDYIPPVDVFVSLAAVIQSKPNSLSLRSEQRESMTIPPHWRANAIFSTTLNMQLDFTTAESYQVTISTELGYNTNQWIVKLDNVTYSIAMEPTSLPHQFLLQVDQRQFSLYACEHTPNQWSVLYAGRHYNIVLTQPDYGELTENHDSAIVAPMNGTVVYIPISPPCRIVKGDTVMVIEAMKMEHKIIATSSGEISETYYQVGDLVSGGCNLVNFTAEGDQ